MNLVATDFAGVSDASRVSSADRSFERIEEHDLIKLAEVAFGKLDSRLSDERLTAHLFKDRLRLMCLCQGAAKHFMDGRHGVKDFDVWAFFAQIKEKDFPPRVRWTADYGQSKFGRHPDDSGFQGRRIDILGRSIISNDDVSDIDALNRWLTSKRTDSAKELAKRPIIGLWPQAYLGKVLWVAPVQKPDTDSR